MTDQIRAPRWLPSGGQAAIDDLLPNLAYLRNNSYVFQNYFVAATSCSPSRASLLTGLYAQQNGMFQTQNPSQPVSLLRSCLYSQGGFPTIGDVLSQVLEYGDGSASSSYDTAWIGKWHSVRQSPVSRLPRGVATRAVPAPRTMGLRIPVLHSPTCKPKRARSATRPYIPSPNGMMDEGNGGDFLDGYDVPDYTAQFPSGVPTPVAPANYLQLNDAAIAYAFTEFWARNIPASPWFLAVSFVNAHDIGAFPYAFALTPESGCAGYFCSAPNPLSQGYLPPPPGPTAVTFGETSCTTSCESETIPAYDGSLYTVAPPALNGDVPWNNADNPGSQPYATLNTKTNQYGKPGLQAFFQTYMAGRYGSVYQDSLNGWLEFLNYYFWIQASVDQKIGQIVTLLQANGANNAPWDNTVVVFTADHGDFGGSHELHEKGGALYDEVINVPLYISYPANRQNNTSISRYFVCSSVDILPFFYYLALGNDSWRSNPSDMVNYLSGRESISDAVFMGNTALQRRLAPGIECANARPEWTNQPSPDILHTSDEYSAAAGSPSHAIAYRTVDVTVNPAGTGTFSGGKMGNYSFWPTMRHDPGYKSHHGHLSPSSSSTATALPRRIPTETTAKSETRVQRPRGCKWGDSPGQTEAPKATTTSFLNTTVQLQLYGIPIQLAIREQGCAKRVSRSI